MGQALQHAAHGRHHVGRKPLGQPAAQRRRIGLSRNHREQHRLACAIVRQHHGSLAHAGMGHEGGLHLGGLDAKSPDLHLRIAPAQELQRTVGTPPRQVAAPIGARPAQCGAGAKRGLCGLVLLQIPLRHTTAADDDFADGPGRQGLPGAVHHGQLHALQRMAQRQDLGPQRQHVVRGVEERGRNGGLRRAIAAEQGHRMAAQRLPLAQAAHENAVAARDHQPQVGRNSRARRLQHAHPLVPERGRQIEHGQPRACHLGMESLQAVKTVLCPQHHAGTAGQRGKDLLGSHIEIGGRELQHAIGLAQAELTRHRRRMVGQVGMAHDHALRGAGRSRGEADIGPLRGVCEPGLLRGAAGRLCHQVRRHQHRMRRPLLRRRRGNDQAHAGRLHHGRALCQRPRQAEYGIGTTTAPGRQHGHRQSQAVAQAQADQVAGPGTRAAQSPGQCVGLAHKLAQRKCRAIRLHGHALRPAIGSAGYQRGYGCRRSALGHGWCGSHGAGLRGQCQPGQCKAARPLPRHMRKLRAQRSHGGRVEQVGVVLHVAGEGFAVQTRRQVQVQLRRRRWHGQRPHGQPLHRQHGCTSGLLHEHGLEQGRAVERPLGPHGLHDALERQVLVLECLQAGAANALQQLGRLGVVAQVDAQRQGVDEETDQSLRLRRVPVGHRAADDDLVLAGPAPQHGGIGGQQRHEGRDACAC